MPQKAWAVGEEVLAADFNTYLQNQCVPAFTGTAQRDAQWAAPPNGAMCVTVDTGSLWQRIGGAWYKPYSPIGRATKTADQTGITTIVDVSGLSVTATVPAGRLLRVQVEALLNSSVAGDTIVGYITDAANTVLTRWAQIVQTGSPPPGQKTFGSVFTTPAGGSVTYKARVERNAGTGTVTVQAGGAYPAYLVVEDLGAV